MKVNRTKILFDTINRLSRRDATEHIRRLLLKSHPSEIAAVVRQLPGEEDGVDLMVKIKDSDKEPLTFVELESHFFKTYLEQTDDKVHVAEVLQKLPEDEAAALLSAFDEEIRQEILSLMKGSIQEEVKEILQYADETCGRIMAINTFHLNQNVTSREAIEQIQKSSHMESLFYIYVVDESEKLTGVVSLRQVLQVEPDRKLKDFMIRDVVRVNVYDSQERAAHFVEEYNFVSLPVVDDDGRLVGVVTVDDVLDYIRDEAQEEVLQMAGVEPEALGDFSYVRAFWFRVLWYGLLLIGGILCSEIILYFFSGYPKTIIYLSFAPLILRLGGSIATQNITFIHQGIISKEIERSRAFKALWGQNLITLLVAVFLALLVTAYGCLRLSHHILIPLGMGFSLMIVVLVSILVGLFMPFIFQRVRFDSLKASSRFVHFLMDALSLYVFFLILSIWNSFVI